jgi:hypothetical protein
MNEGICVFRFAICDLRTSVVVTTREVGTSVYGFKWAYQMTRALHRVEIANRKSKIANP